jgi:hypothetical protein
MITVETGTFPIYKISKKQKEECHHIFLNKNEIVPKKFQKYETYGK